MALLFSNPVNSDDAKGANPLNSGNIDMTLGKKYIDWFRFINFLFFSVLLMHLTLVSFCLAASNELVFINFYAEWCRFSNLLQPIFDEAADKVCKIYGTN